MVTAFAWVPPTRKYTSAPGFSQAARIFSRAAAQKQSSP